MKQTAVNSLIEALLPFIDRSKVSDMMLQDIVSEHLAMEKEQSHKYAEFAIRCDRKDMKILNFEDWIKLETFKSE